VRAVEVAVGHITAPESKDSNASTVGQGAVDARLSPDGKTLLVNGSKANAVASFAVNGGTLTELPNSPTPLPAGAIASGIVVD
jgi:hypothetical protein